MAAVAITASHKVKLKGWNGTVHSGSGFGFAIWMQSHLNDNWNNWEYFQTTHQEAALIKIVRLGHVKHFFSLFSCKEVGPSYVRKTIVLKTNQHHILK
jgi:hypothetical protein